MERSSSPSLIDSIKRFGFWTRFTIVAASFLLYLGIFALLGEAAGIGLLAVAALPVLAGGWLFGLPGGLLTFLGAVAANAFLVAAWAGVPAFPEAILMGGNLAGSLVLLGVALGAAWLSRLYDTVKADIDAQERSRKELEESERRYRILFENLPVALGVTDERGRLIAFNAEMLRPGGYSNEDMASITTVADLYFDPADRAIVMQELAEKGSVKDLEIRFKKKGGSPYLGRLTVVPIDIGGEPRRLAIVADITEEVRAREKMETLYLLTQSLNEQQDLKALLHRVAGIAADLLDADGGGIYLFDPVERQLVIEVSTADFIPVGSRLAPGEGLAGRVFVAGEGRIIEDYSTWEGRAASYLDLPFRAVVEVPLVYAGEVLGVLAVYQVGESRRKYSQSDLHLLSTYASQAAGAVHNARLYASLERSNVELARAYDHTLEGWARALDLRDSLTEGHTQRVTEMTLRLARALGIAGEELDHIRRGALLHDIGKMSIPDHILLKNGPLDEAEWGVMKKHPAYAMEFIRPVEFLAPALDIPYCHHECWDGSGYPRGLKGEEIPIAARIFAVVDAWDALRSNRPYREAWPEDDVLRQLRLESGGRFDPAIVEAFLELLNGSRVPEPAEAAGD